MTESLSGRLLLASPTLRGGVFERSVVLVLHHDADGAVGLVLNRPGHREVDEVVPGWAGHAYPPRVVFTGGPVAPDQLLGLARRRVAGAPLSAVVGTVDVANEAAGDDVEGVRVFTGYAGWSPGQLEGEIDVGGWFVVHAAVDDPFSSVPRELWRAVLRRQSDALALLATFPEDPALN